MTSRTIGGDFVGRELNVNRSTENWFSLARTWMLANATILRGY